MADNPDIESKDLQWNPPHGIQLLYFYADPTRPDLIAEMRAFITIPPALGGSPMNARRLEDKELNDLLRNLEVRDGCSTGVVWIWLGRGQVRIPILYSADRTIDVNWLRSPQAWKLARERFRRANAF